MQQQLTLDIKLRDTSSFDNYFSPRNAEVVASLTAAVMHRGGGEVYLWGSAGSGKTHLLQASCRLAAERDRPTIYLPLARVNDLSVNLLEGLELADAVLCLDDLQAIAGRRDWETALFTLADNVREGGGVFIAAGTAAPDALGLAMPELVSRLARGLVYRLIGLSDSEKKHALQLRARSRGLELSDEVAAYVLARFPRDVTALFQWLEEIDAASLEEQRRITIPFVRRIRDRAT